MFRIDTVHSLGNKNALSECQGSPNGCATAVSSLQKSRSRNIKVDMMQLVLELFKKWMEGYQMSFFIKVHLNS